MSDLVYNLTTLARITMEFGEVERATLHPDGRTWETDTTHTLMLMFCAMEILPTTALKVCSHAVLQLIAVHDLVEVYADDTNTIGGLTDQQRADKDAREEAALVRLRMELAGTSVLRWLERYERQECPESQFVRYLDKTMPKLTHTWNYGAAVREAGLDHAQLVAAHVAQRAALRDQYPLLAPVLDQLFAETAKNSEDAFLMGEAHPVLPV